ISCVGISSLTGITVVSPATGLQRRQRCDGYCTLGGRTSWPSRCPAENIGYPPALPAIESWCLTFWGSFMRAACWFAITLALLGLGAANALAKGTRHGIAVDQKTFPQASAKETLSSVLAAIAASRHDYLVAQLADPAWVDERVARLYGGRF